MKRVMERKRIFVFVAIALLLIAGALLVSRFPPFSRAYAGLLGGSFGGRILTIVPCTCSGGASIIVGPPGGGNFYISPLSKIYPVASRLTLHPTQWILGSSVPGAPPCLTGVPPACVPTNLPTATVTQAGVSR